MKSSPRSLVASVWTSVEHERGRGDRIGSAARQRRWRRGGGGPAAGRRVARAAYLGTDPGDLSALENPLAVEGIAAVGLATTR